MTSHARGVRLWPALVILALAAGFLLWNWGSDDPAFRQQQVVRTLATAVLAGFGLLVWWLFFSRLARAVRFAGVALVVALGLGFRARYELRGFSGDLVPRIVPRGSSELPPLPPAEPETAAEAPPAVEPPTLAEAPAAPDAGSAADAGVAGSLDPASPAVADADPPAPGDPSAAAVSRPSFPQFLGPGRDARLPGPRLARDWNAAPPVQLWRQPIGAGWAGFAVADGIAVTQEQRAGHEAVVAYDMDTGLPLWSHRREASFESPLAGDGPRATPAIAPDGTVYAYGATGLLAALDLRSGSLRFERNVLAETAARPPTHGVAASPLLLDGDLVVVLAGGPDGASLVAYDRRTGERRWSGGDDPAAYSSPVAATLGGVPQIVVFNQVHVTGHDAATGAVLWFHPWPRGSERVSQPVFLEGDRIFVSTGYGIGGQMLGIQRAEDGSFSVTQLYETRRLKAKFTQVVEYGGDLYGLDDGVLVCLDPETGQRRWKGGRYGHGQVLLVGELLLVQAEDGTVVLVDPGPEALVELGRFDAVRGRAWATPALVGDRLIVRGESEVACYRLPTLRREASTDAP